MTAVRVALVEDHHMVREGLRAVLTQERDFEIVGEASDARSAYTIVDTTQPDVVVMDLMLPGASGLSIARELLRRDRKRKVLFMSARLTEDAVAEGLSMGALGYISKDQPWTDLVSAIRTVSTGQPYLSPRISQFVVDDYMRLRSGGQREPGPLVTLSPREREVFELLLQGLSNDGIAAQLYISRRTVETHRAHVLKKLNVHSIPGLFRFAAQHGLLVA
jgi:DNA-binding NarL/FixJ family response regulator